MLVLGAMKQHSHASSHQESVDARLAAIAARNHGVFSRAQAKAAGADRGQIQHRLATRRWVIVHLGVYRLNGLPRSWHQALVAACLAIGARAVVSHRAAGALWRLPGFEPDVIEVTVNRARSVRRPGILVHRSTVLDPVDLGRIDGVPVTSPARTLVDLAGIVTPEVLEEALDDALRRRLTTIGRLRWRISELGRRGRPGIGVLGRMLDERSRGSVPKSVLETRTARFIRKAGLPEPVRQYPIRRGATVVAVVDFAYPEIKLAIEADGYRWHSGRARWEHDRARANALTHLGWRVIYVTSRDVEQRPRETARSIREAYASPAQAIGPSKNHSE